MQHVTKKSRWPNKEANKKTTPPCNDHWVDVMFARSFFQKAAVEMWESLVGKHLIVQWALGLTPWHNNTSKWRATKKSHEAKQGQWGRMQKGIRLCWEPIFHHHLIMDMFHLSAFQSHQLSLFVLLHEASLMFTKLLLSAQCFVWCQWLALT